MRRAGLAVAMALLLGMFNPLFCIVHCAVIDALSREHTSFGRARFVCSLIGASHSSADEGHIPDQNPATPRAVYDGVLTLLILCTTLLLIAARLMPPPRQRWCSESLAPPPPPPKSWRPLPAGLYGR